MKLIKINTDHYIVVDNSLDFSETDYYWDDKQKEIRTGSNNHVTGGYKIKITHSTQPIEQYYAAKDGTIPFVYHKIIELPLSEIKELLGKVDVEKRAKNHLDEQHNNEDIAHPELYDAYHSFLKGYTQALEDNKDKKYTEEDVINIVDNVSQNWFKCYSHNDKKEHLLRITKHLQKTEWEVDIINGKLTLKQ